jgi:hypothetical protein
MNSRASRCSARSRPIVLRPINAGTPHQREKRLIPWEIRASSAAKVFEQSCRSHELNFIGLFDIGLRGRLGSNAQMAASIPIEVERFLVKYITSLEQLEVLLLVSALPDREWSQEDVYRVVMTTPPLVSQRLEEFVQAGFLTRSGQPALYRYAPRSEDLAHQLANVGAFYKISRHKVVEFIYSNKREPISEFSEAFRLKREK